MCFYHEYDYCPEVYSKNERMSERPVECEECGATIEPGQTIHSVFMQQYEQCHVCEMGECVCDHKTNDDCQCATPVFGETFDYDRCEQCEKFLQAVEDAEVEAGCSKAEARPAFQEMRNDIVDGGMREAKKYFKRARYAYPELVASGYLGKLWRCMFV